MPIERAEPAMILAAASMSLAFRSFIFASAISRTWAMVTLPTLSRFGTLEPLATLAALRRYQLRSEEHTSELQSLMRISYAVFCLKKKKEKTNIHVTNGR